MIEETIYKVVLLGPDAIGKTKLTYRFIDDKYEPNYLHTLGVDFGFGKCIINGDTVRLKIYDVGGNQVISPHYFEETCIFLIAVDLTETVEENKRRLEALYNNHLNLMQNPEIVKFIAGTKGDDPKAVIEPNLQMMAAFAEQYPNINCHVFNKATSASTGENVQEAFATPTKLYVDQQKTKALKQAEVNSSENIITYEAIYQYSCFSKFSSAIKIVQDDIQAYKTEEVPPTLQAFEMSLKNLRNKLAKMYLQQLPGNIAKAIERGESLSKEQQEQLKTIYEVNAKKITAIGTEAEKVADFVSKHLHRGSGLRYPHK